MVNIPTIRAQFEDRIVFYIPIRPSEDSEALAKSDRLILIHSRHHDQPLIVVAHKGELREGWVIGIVSTTILL